MDQNDKIQNQPENCEDQIELNETDLEQVDGGLNFSRPADHSVKGELSGKGIIAVNTGGMNKALIGLL